MSNETVDVLAVMTADARDAFDFRNANETAPVLIPMCDSIQARKAVARLIETLGAAPDIRAMPADTFYMAYTAWQVTAAEVLKACQERSESQLATDIHGNSYWKVQP